MSRHHAQMLRSVFHDPPSHNLHWREVESLLHHVGATIDAANHGGIHIRLGVVNVTLHRPHHSHTLDTGTVLKVRDILARGGVTPASYEAEHAARGEGTA